MASFSVASTRATLITWRHRAASVLQPLFLDLKPVAQNIWLFAWVLVVVVASQIALFAQPIVGIYVNALALLALIGLGLWQERARQLAISVAIIPVITMISLSLPKTSMFTQLVVFYDGLLLFGLVYRYMFTLDQPFSKTRLRSRGYLFGLPLMLVIGQALGVLGYLLLRHHYSFSSISLPLVASLAIVFAISEEVLFHGLIQQRASALMHPALAIMLPTILYTSLTIGHTGSSLSTLFGFILSLTLAITYYKKQNLLLTFAVNITAKLVYIGLVASFVFR